MAPCPNDPRLPVPSYAMSMTPIYSLFYQVVSANWYPWCVPCTTGIGRGKDSQAAEAKPRGPFGLCLFGSGGPPYPKVDGVPLSRPKVLQRNAERRIWQGGESGSQFKVDDPMGLPIRQQDLLRR